MKKILIVDDERDIVECLDMNLRKKGYATAFAYDGTEAVLTAGGSGRTAFCWT